MEHNERTAAAEAENTTPTLVDLEKLAAEIVPYCVQNNAEPDACDLLMEVGAGREALCCVAVAGVRWRRGRCA